MASGFIRSCGQGGSEASRRQGLHSMSGHAFSGGRATAFGTNGELVPIPSAGACTLEASRQAPSIDPLPVSAFRGKPCSGGLVSPPAPAWCEQFSQNRISHIHPRLLRGRLPAPKGFGGHRAYKANRPAGPAAVRGSTSAPSARFNVLPQVPYLRVVLGACNLQLSAFKPQPFHHV
jgi:hypothetical protein